MFIFYIFKRWIPKEKNERFKGQNFLAAAHQKFMNYENKTSNRNKFDLFIQIKVHFSKSILTLMNVKRSLGTMSHR